MIWDNACPHDGSMKIHRWYVIFHVQIFLKHDPKVSYIVIKTNKDLPNLDITVHWQSGMM